MYLDCPWYNWVRGVYALKCNPQLVSVRRCFMFTFGELSWAPKRSEADSIMTVQWQQLAVSFNKVILIKIIIICHLSYVSPHLLMLNPSWISAFCIILVINIKTVLFSTSIEFWNIMSLPDLYPSFEWDHISWLRYAHYWNLILSWPFLYLRVLKDQVQKINSHLSHCLENHPLPNWQCGP